MWCRFHQRCQEGAEVFHPSVEGTFQQNAEFRQPKVRSSEDKTWVSCFLVFLIYMDKLDFGWKNYSKILQSWDFL